MCLEQLLAIEAGLFRETPNKVGEGNGIQIANIVVGRACCLDSKVANVES